MATPDGTQMSFLALFKRILSAQKACRTRRIPLPIAYTPDALRTKAREMRANRKGDGYTAEEVEEEVKRGLWKLGSEYRQLIDDWGDGEKEERPSRRNQGSERRRGTVVQAQQSQGQPQERTVAGPTERRTIGASPAPESPASPRLPQNNAAEAANPGKKLDWKWVGIIVLVVSLLGSGGLHLKQSEWGPFNDTTQEAATQADEDEGDKTPATSNKDTAEKDSTEKDESDAAWSVLRQIAKERGLDSKEARQKFLTDLAKKQAGEKKETETKDEK